MTEMTAIVNVLEWLTALVFRSRDHDPVAVQEVRV